MRSGIIGFVIGTFALLLALALVRQKFLPDILTDISYHFDHYALDEASFPKGDFDQGRLVRRLLFPAYATIKFYDSAYREVTRPEKPGRYGAVVKMNICGKIAYRFITLYRTPTVPFWWDTPWTMSVELPAAAGIDPAVIRNQQAEIVELIKNEFVARGDEPMLAVLLAGLAETSASDPPAVRRTNILARNETWWYGLRKQLGLEPKYPYMVDLPRDYDTDPNKKWPVVLYLHSGAERGSNMYLVRTTGLPRFIHEGRVIPAIMIAPQCPNAEDWSVEALAQLLDEVAAKYRVDLDRIYLTGGTATWTLAEAYPERIAAMVSIEGTNDPGDATRLSQIPIWAFQGKGETFAPEFRTTNMIDALIKAGGHPHLTFTDGHFDAWDIAYTTDAIYPWLMAQKRGQPEVITPGVPQSGQ